MDHQLVKIVVTSWSSMRDVLLCECAVHKGTAIMIFEKMKGVDMTIDVQNKSKPLILNTFLANSALKFQKIAYVTFKLYLDKI